MDLMKVSFSSVESLNVDDIENDSVFDVKRDEGEWIVSTWDLFGEI